MGKMEQERKREGTGLPERAEDLLKGLAQGRHLERVWGTGELASSGLGSAVGQEQLEGAGMAEQVGSGWRLTRAGRARALVLVRAHRLMETYLARKAGVSASNLHALAERAEHTLSEEGVRALAKSLNHPRFDPHGDPIPQEESDMSRMGEVALKTVEAGQVVRVVHIEDEPEGDFHRLMQSGIALELPLRVVEQKADQTRIELAGEILELPGPVRDLVEVRLCPEAEAEMAGLLRLDSLPPGEEAEVASLSPACMGPERRRLMDFGMVPGSRVRCEFSSPFGSPTAYRVRESTLGLRREQARNIFIRKTI